MAMTNKKALELLGKVKAGDITAEEAMAQINTRISTIFEAVDPKLEAAIKKQIADGKMREGVYKISAGKVQFASLTKEGKTINVLYRAPQVKKEAVKKDKSEKK